MRYLIKVFYFLCSATCLVARENNPLEEKSLRSFLPQAFLEKLNLCEKLTAMGCEEAQKELFDLQLDIAFSYHYGRNGLKRDLSKALEFYEKLTETGDEKFRKKLFDLQLYIGDSYYYGLNGFKQDLFKALNWYEKLTAMGCEEGKRKLFDLQIRPWHFLP